MAQPTHIGEIVKGFMAQLVSGQALPNSGRPVASGGPDGRAKLQDIRRQIKERGIRRLPHRHSECLDMPGYTSSDTVVIHSG